MIHSWHSLLDMERQDKEWLESDMLDELEEYRQETRLISRWSELSDVVYTYTFTLWCGFDMRFPLRRWQYALGAIYMIPKYSGRWLFFKRAGRKAGSTSGIREVRNPKKTHKLQAIAKQYDVDPQRFQEICEKQLKYWPLLP